MCIREVSKIHQKSNIIYHQKYNKTANINIIYQNLSINEQDISLYPIIKPLKRVLDNRVKNITLKHNVVATEIRDCREQGV